MVNGKNGNIVNTVICSTKYGGVQSGEWRERAGQEIALLCYVVWSKVWHSVLWCGIA